MKEVECKKCHEVFLMDNTFIGSIICESCDPFMNQSETKLSCRARKYIEVLKRRRDFLMSRSAKDKRPQGDWDLLEAHALTWVLIQIGEEQPKGEYENS